MMFTNLEDVCTVCGIVENLSRHKSRIYACVAPRQTSRQFWHRLTLTCFSAAGLLIKQHIPG